MEVAGSIIAIGQAAAAIPELIDTIRTFANIKSDLLELHNELATIQAHVKSVECTVGSFSTAEIQAHLAVPEPHSIRSARIEIESVCRDLQSLIDKCVIKTENDTLIKVRRIIYTWKSRDIKKLQAKLEHCRQQLHLGLSEMLLLTQKRVLLQISTVTHIMHLNGASHEKDDLSQPQRGSDSQSSTKKTTNALVVNPNHLVNDDRRFEDPLSLKEQSSEIISVYHTRNWSHTGSDSSFADQKAVRIETSILGPYRCPSRCRCRCHTKSTDYQSPGWLKPLLGSFFLHYDSLPVFPMTGLKCDLSECRNSSSTVCFQYHFPDWLLRRALLISASMESFVSIGAYLAVPRIVDSDDEIWHSIRLGKTTQFQNRLIKNTYRPEDYNIRGDSLIAYAINWEQPHIVEFLVNAWNLGNRRHFTDRNAMIWAREELLVNSESYDSRHKRVLKTLAALEDGYTYRDESVLVLNGPQAMLQGTIVLQELLDRDPSAVHDTDDCGVTALHLACLMGRPDVVELLIERDAPLDACDCRGKTPLVDAVRYGNYDCAELLLGAGCRPDVADMEGQSVLYYAMERNLTLGFELLKQLITQYPRLAAAQDIGGRASLHWLSDVFGPADLAEQLLGLLLQAGAALEARDQHGLTPLKVAVSEDNAMAVQLLLQAGAKVDPPPTLSGRNVLHLAALYAGQGTLNILADANIRGLDVDAADSYGNTPLDLWRWRKYTDSNNLLAQMTHPTVEEDHAFEALLQGVRDRTFQADIELCNLVLQAAKDEDYISARELLEPVQNNEAGHHTYRGCSALRTTILLQLKSGMWETAIAELEDMIETRRQRMMHSPFREEPNYYYADDSSSSSEDDEDEGAEDVDSVEDSGSAVQDQIVEEMELANGAPMESPKGV